MLIIEIILTIIAWNRGWKWWALLPLGIAFGFGFIAGASGMSQSDLEGLLFLDVIAIIALVIMIAVKKKEVPAETSEKK